MIYLIIFSIVLSIFFGYWFYKLTFGNFKIKYDNFTIFQGMLGSGKTSMLSYLAINELNKRRIANIFRWIIFVVLFIIPIFNIFHLVKTIKEKGNYFKKFSIKVYSNFPIDVSFRILGFRVGKKHFSICIDKDFFYYKYKVMENSIIVFDELQYILPNVINGRAVVSDDKLRLTLTYLRHCTDCVFFGATQSFGEINVTFRRKVNYLYELNNIKVRKFLKFLPSRVGIRQLNYSEDVSSGNIQIVEEDKKILANFYFYFPYNRFVSRYAKALYNLSDEDLKYISLNYNNLLSYFDFVVGDEWQRIEFKR